MKPEVFNNRSIKNGARILCIYVFLLLVCAGIIYPILWIFFSSFNAIQTMFSSTLIPKYFTLDNYKWLFTSPESDYATWLFNSLKISAANVCVQVSLVALTAYAYSRFKFKGKKFGLVMFMVLQILPITSAMIAFYTLGILLGFVQYAPHVYLVLIYAGSAIPGNTYLMKGYLDSIPRDLDEAAYIDGASRFATLFRIIMPLAKPMLAVQALWAFTTPLQDYVMAKLIIRDPKDFTLAVGLQQFVTSKHGTGTVEFTKFAAGSLLIALPIAVLFIFLQKYLISGLLSGGTKG
jgi:arabinogalactan oligomer/maltooligosaccharide transport system permease protein